MPENVSQYKCPTCGSTLAFDAEHQRLRCEKCGNSYDVSAFSEKSSSGQGFTWGGYKNNMSDDILENTKVYQCEACGAMIETEETTAATRCPFCDNNVVINDRVSGGIKPNSIIPFKVKIEDLHEIVTQFYKGKTLLPNNFFSKSVIDNAKGVYVPFWLFNSDIDGDISYKATKVRSYRSGNYSCTETKHYILARSGSMSFSGVPVDASVKADNDTMDSLEPFDYSKMKVFDRVYLTGYYADRFDSSPDDEIGRAGKRIRNSAYEEFRETAKGYTTVSVMTDNLNLKNMSVSYVLLPVYFINCHYKNKLYQYTVNGQTGKIVGELPVSVAKIWFYFLRAFTVAATIAGAVFYMLAD